MRIVKATMGIVVVLSVQFGKTLGFFNRHQLLSRIADHRATLHDLFEPTLTVSAALPRAGIRPMLKVSSRLALSLAKRTTQIE